MATFLQALVNGILLGGLYAIIAVGLSMIFGVIKQVNLAHGALMIMGSYLSLVTLQILGLHPLLTLLLVMPSMFFFGYVVQIILFNRVMQKGMEPFLMVSFGLAIILENTLLVIFTPDARSLTTQLAIQSIDVFGVLHLPVIYLVNCAVGIFILVLLHQFMNKTYLGWAITASADDVDAAKLVGINPKKVYALAMGIAMATAAIAGVLVGMTFTFYPHSGGEFLIIAFGVVIIGGLGSLLGTLVGGIIFGVAQTLGAHILGGGFQLLSGYIILLTMLVIKPQGLFGRR